MGFLEHFTFSRFLEARSWLVKFCTVPGRMVTVSLQRLKEQYPSWDIYCKTLLIKTLNFTTGKPKRPMTKMLDLIDVSNWRRGNRYCDGREGCPVGTTLAAGTVPK
jgi:hypothetical protein